LRDRGGKFVREPRAEREHLLVLQHENGARGHRSVFGVTAGKIEIVQAAMAHVAEQRRNLRGECGKNRAAAALAERAGERLELREAACADGNALAGVQKLAADLARGGQQDGS